MRIVFFSFVCIVSGTDDQSLMQHGVGIESSTLSESVAKAVLHAKEAVEEAPEGLVKTSRKMAIDQLLNKVTSQTPEATAIASVIGFFNQIIAELQTEMVEYTNEITRVNGYINDCNDDQMGICAGCDQSLNNSFYTYVQFHDSCRGTDAVTAGTEFQLRKTLGQDCDHVSARLLSIQEDLCPGASPADNPGTCTNHWYGCQTQIDALTSPTNQAEEIQAEVSAGVWATSGFDHPVRMSDFLDNFNMETLLHSSHLGNDGSAGVAAVWKTGVNAIHAHFNSDKGDWDSDKVPCKTAAQAFTAKTLTCDTFQNNAEDSYCAWREKREYIKYHRSNCVTHFQALYDCSKARVDKHNGGRVIIVMHMRQIVKWLTALQVNQIADPFNYTGGATQQTELVENQSEITTEFTAGYASKIDLINIDTLDTHYGGLGPVSGTWRSDWYGDIQSVWEAIYAGEVYFDTARPCDDLPTLSPETYTPACPAGLPATPIYGA